MSKKEKFALYLEATGKADIPQPGKEAAKPIKSER